MVEEISQDTELPKVITFGDLDAELKKLPPERQDKVMKLKWEYLDAKKNGTLEKILKPLEIQTSLPYGKQVSDQLASRSETIFDIIAALKATEDESQINILAWILAFKVEETEFEVNPNEASKLPRHLRSLDGKPLLN